MHYYFFGFSERVKGFLDCFYKPEKTHPSRIVEGFRRRVQPVPLALKPLHKAELVDVRGRGGFVQPVLVVLYYSGLLREHFFMGRVLVPTG